MTVRSRWRHSRSRRAGSAGGFHLLKRDLVAFWNFEEPDGGPYADELPRATALDWAEEGTVTKGEGRPGEGVTLIRDGVTNSYLRLTYAELSAAGNEDVLFKLQDWTLAFALYLDGTPPNPAKVFMTNNTQAIAGVQLQVATGNLLNLALRDSDEVHSGNFAQALTSDAWNHIIIRHEHEAQTEFVLNGTPATPVADTRVTSAIEGTLDNGVQDWFLGRTTTSVGGTFDSLGRWNRLITDYECGLLYEGFTK